MRICVESCFTICAPRGLLQEKSKVSLFWQREHVSVLVEVRLVAGTPMLSIQHDYYGGRSQLISLNATPANLGGQRWWFLCPNCSARVHRLHLPGRGSGPREFKCRGCHSLSYESAQSSRSFSRAFFLLRARELGCSYREARDNFRHSYQTRGAYLYEPRTLRFD